MYTHTLWGYPGIYPYTLGVPGYISMYSGSNRVYTHTLWGYPGMYPHTLGVHGNTPEYGKATTLVSGYPKVYMHPMNTKQTAPRTDDLYDLFPLDLPGRADLLRILLYTPYMYDLAHFTGWEPYNLIDLAHVSSVGAVTMQIQHGLSGRRVRNEMIWIMIYLICLLDDLDRYLFDLSRG